MTLSPVTRTLACLIAVMAIAGLVAEFLTSAAAHPEDTVLQVIWRLVRFFTILTNALVAVTFVMLGLRGRVASPVWLGGVALWIAIVGVVYHLLLASTDGVHVGLGWWANFIVHGTVPAAVMLWWMAFAPREGLSTRSSLLWMAWPLIYVIYALARGQIDGIYPYFFTNPDKLGWAGVAKWTGLLALSFFIAGLAQIAIARLIRR